MKKFLTFLVSLVVVVCFGLTIYYFVRNNEVITIKTKEIYCNAGDTIPLKSLGISMKNANISKKTVFNYNAGGDEVTKYIRYDNALNSFVVSEDLGGEVVLVISTTNDKYPDFTINVHIGNGSKESPYYIFNQNDLAKIGSVYRLNKNYVLMNDINLTADFQPIGYNDVAKAWSGFSGTFDGQNNTISGLQVVNQNIDNVGLFSSINSGAQVKNLTIANTTISGDYKTAGVVAGTVSGTIDKVIVKNANITNIKADGKTGSFAGMLDKGQSAISYAENVTIAIGSDQAAVNGAIAGGLIGDVNEANIKACYTNNVEIKSNGTSVLGGFAGRFVIGTDTGSIQQSYSNTTSTDANFGAFIGKIEASTGFKAADANILSYLIGNIAIVYGKDAASSIKDEDLVKVYDKTFFKNMAYANRAVFYEKDSAMYLVRGFAGVGDAIDTNEYVYYGVDAANLVMWDTTYIWDTTKNSLPTLKMGSIYPSAPSVEYLRRDLEQKDLNNKNAFLEMFKNNIQDESIKLLDDMNLGTSWTPTTIKNSIIDGNNKTITLTLNKAVDSKLGLFATIDNCTVKNLNIVISGVTANATNAGGLAGVITSSTAGSSSSIENVKITYKGFGSVTIENFGGLAGSISSTTVDNCSVSGLSMSSSSVVTNAGSLVAVNNGTIKASKAGGTIYATTMAGGAVAANNGTLSGVTGSVTVKYIKTTADASIGGIVASNKGVLTDANMTANIEISNAGSTTYVGGIAGNNFGEISNSVVKGDNITVKEFAARINVGGVAGVNHGTISNVNNAIKNIGSVYNSASQYVGGVAAINNGTINKVLTQSNLSGNWVAGVVVVMNSTSAKVNEVAVGKYSSAGKSFTANTIKAVKYGAGVVVDFKSGSIENVQCTSELNGQTNSTRNSLVALIFPYGTSLKNATINSSLTGYGTKYRETWTDFASYTNKSEFGLSNGETGDERFNVYKYDSYHGIMQSVVINGSKSGVSDAKAAMGAAFAWGKDYQDTSESSFIKVVDGFSDASQFQGSFTFVCAISTLLNLEHKATKTLTFNIGSVWESNNGISLKFLSNF